MLNTKLWSLGFAVWKLRVTAEAWGAPLCLLHADTVLICLSAPLAPTHLQCHQILLISLGSPAGVTPGANTSPLQTWSHISPTILWSGAFGGIYMRIWDDRFNASTAEFTTKLLQLQMWSGSCADLMVGEVRCPSSSCLNPASWEHFASSCSWFHQINVSGSTT